MSYNPRYKFNYTNELQELVEIYFDAKSGMGGVFTGDTYIQIVSDTSLIAGLFASIDAFQIGSTIAFEGHSYIITSFTYDPAVGYTCTIGAGGLTGIASNTKTITVLAPGASFQETIDGIISCKINCNSDSSLILDPIITRELLFTVNITAASTINADTFIDSEHDSWMVRAYIDGVAVFHGFLLPDEGPIPMQDKPYEMTLHATDGLKLIGKTKFTRVDNTEFNGKHTLIELVASALYKTGLGLGIKVYSSLYYTTMLNRTDDPKYDMFQQAYLDYRTFMTSSTDFINCYTALQMILKDHYRLYYEEGQWVIYRLAEAQFLRSGFYYSTYDANGNVISGGVNADDYAKVGKNNIIRAINQNQTLSANFANKVVRHDFNYNIWDEIPRNNKFERVTLDPAAANTALDKYYIIKDWDFGRVNSGLVPPFPATSAQCWRHSKFNTYGVEIDREIIMQANVDSSYRKILQSKDIPVNKNDKINLSFEIKLSQNISIGSYLAAYVYIRDSASSAIWYLQVPTTTGQTGKWITSGSPQAVHADFGSGENSTVFKYINFDSDSIPVDGSLYVAFLGDTLSGGDVYFKGFSLTYTPYIAGGYVPVKGDYWQRTQNKNFADTYQTEVQVSDSPVGAGKGTLWYNNGIAFVKTLTRWFRYGLGGGEERHYKELVNVGVYNLTYRRFRKIQGEFDGTKYENNSDGMIHPISFTPKYGFEDFATFRKYLLVCPVTIDAVKGSFTGTFVEVYKDANDGQQAGDVATFNYIFS